MYCGTVLQLEALSCAVLGESISAQRPRFSRSRHKQEPKSYSVCGAAEKAPVLVLHDGLYCNPARVTLFSTNLLFFRALSCVCPRKLSGQPVSRNSPYRDSPVCPRVCPGSPRCLFTGTVPGREFVGRSGTCAEEAYVRWRAAVADAAIAVHGDSHGAAIE